MEPSEIIIEEINRKAVHVFGWEGDYFLTIEVLEDKEMSKNRYTTVAPPEHKQGYERIFNKSTELWSHVIDHRGEIAYSVKTGEASIVNYLGKLKGGFTFNTPDEVDASQPIVS